MTNHPNRTWRARMRAAADQWLTTTQARVLAEVPIARDEYETGMNNRLREAYLAGYSDGRRSTQRRA